MKNVFYLKSLFYIKSFIRSYFGGKDKLTINNIPLRIKFAKCVLFFFYFHFVLLLFLIFLRLFPIYPCGSHCHLFVFPISSLYLHYFILPPSFANLLINSSTNFMCPCGLHRHLYKLCQSFKSLAKLKSTNNLLFISALASTFLLLRFVVPSFIVRLLFVVEPL